MGTYLIRKPFVPGLTTIHQADREKGEILSFRMLTLGPGETVIMEPGDEEIGLVFLTGLVDLDISGTVYTDLCGRTSVFAGKATGAFIPPGVGYEISAKSCAEVAICSAPSDSEGPAQVITPNEVQVNHVGNFNWTRDVNNIILGNVPQAKHVVVGETFNPPGNWSSYPPHKHEVDNFPWEVKMEEIYLFRFNPQQGFGIQHMYNDDFSLDETYAVRENDAVYLPFGYHPVCAAPGYQLYYLWMMAAPNDRRMRPNDDPRHAWVKAVGAIEGSAGR
jgi:5-deoxy-glucuronate isomerase